MYFSSRCSTRTTVLTLLLSLDSSAIARQHCSHLPGDTARAPARICLDKLGLSEEIASELIKRVARPLAARLFPGIGETLDHHVAFFDTRARRCASSNPWTRRSSTKIGARRFLTTNWKMRPRLYWTSALKASPWRVLTIKVFPRDRRGAHPPVRRSVSSSSWKCFAV